MDPTRATPMPAPTPRSSTRCARPTPERWPRSGRSGTVGQRARGEGDRALHDRSCSVALALPRPGRFRPPKRRSRGTGLSMSRDFTPHSGKQTLHSRGGAARAGVDQPGRPTMATPSTDRLGGFRLYPRPPTDPIVCSGTCVTRRRTIGRRTLRAPNYLTCVPSV